MMTQFHARHSAQVKLSARPRGNGVAALSDRALARTYYGIITIAAFGFVGALVLGIVH